MNCEWEMRGSRFCKCPKCFAGQRLGRIELATTVTLPAADVEKIRRALASSVGFLNARSDALGWCFCCAARFEETHHGDCALRQTRAAIALLPEKP